METHYQQRLGSVSSVQAWFVTVIVSFFFLYDFGLGNAFNVLTPELLKHYQMLNETSLSFIASAYFWINLLCLLPAAYLLDRFSPKKAILTTLLICAICILLMAKTNSVVMFTLARLSMGLASAFSLVGCIRIATNWFPSTQMGLVTGVIIAIGMLGGYIVQSPLHMLLSATGLIGTILFIGGLGLVLALCILLFVQDTPPGFQKARAQQVAELKGIPVVKTLTTILSQWKNWCPGLYVGFLNIPTWVLGGMWANAYLENTHHLSETAASIVSGELFLGMIVAYPFWGWLTEKIQRRKLPLIGASLAALVTIGLIILFPFGYMGMMILFFILGFLIGAQTIAYPLVVEINPQKNTAVATSVVSMNSLFWGGVIGIPLFGLILQWVGGVAAYNVAMLLIVFGFLVSFLLSLGLKETYCQRQVE